MASVEPPMADELNFSELAKQVELQGSFFVPRRDIYLTYRVLVFLSCSR
jgi:hypothetical protein